MCNLACIGYHVPVGVYDGWHTVNAEPGIDVLFIA
jgi:hypothetical protein